MTERKFTPPTSFPAEYVTTKGEKMTLLAEGIGEYKYIGQCEDDLWWTFTADGSNRADGVPSTTDLHDIPKTNVQWANDYEEIFGCTWHDSREEADANAMWDCIAVIRREWTEGQPPEYFTEEARMSEYSYDKAPTNPHHGGKMTPTDMVRYIEELETRLRSLLLEHISDLAQAQEAYEQVVELEANLAKAVEALEFYATQDITYPNVGTVTFHGHDDNGLKARTTLAELTGGKDE